MHTSILDLLIIAIVAGRVAVEVVLHEGVGEDLRELVLLEQCLHLRRCSFISGVGGLLGLEPHLLRLPATLERGGEDAVKAVEVPPRPCSGAAEAGAPFLHQRAEGGAPGLHIVVALATRLVVPPTAIEPPSAIPPAARARHLLSPRVAQLTGKRRPSLLDLSSE